MPPCNPDPAETDPGLTQLIADNPQLQKLIALRARAAALNLETQGWATMYHHPHLDEHSANEQDPAHDSGADKVDTSITVTLHPSPAPEPPRVVVANVRHENIDVRIRNVAQSSEHSSVDSPHAPISDASWSDISLGDAEEGWVDMQRPGSDGSWEMVGDVVEEEEVVEAKVRVITVKDGEWEVWVRVQG